MLYEIAYTFLMLCISPLAWSGSCGGGYVKKIFVGGWNSDDLIIQIDFSKAVSEHPETLFSGQFVRFKPTSIPGRFDRVNSLVLSAYIAGISIKFHSCNNDCSNATEVAFYY